MEKCCRAWQATEENITRRMRIEYWISKAPNTGSEYVILTVSPGNIDYEHALQHSVTSTLPVLYLSSNEHRPPARVLAALFDFVFTSFV